MGHKDDSSDIYVIDLTTKEVTNITNDIFQNLLQAGLQMVK